MFGKHWVRVWCGKNDMRAAQNMDCVCGHVVETRLTLMENLCCVSWKRMSKWQSSSSLHIVESSTIIATLNWITSLTQQTSSSANCSARSSDKAQPFNIKEEVLVELRGECWHGKNHTQVAVQESSLTNWSYDSFTTTHGKWIDTPKLWLWHLRKS